MNNRPMPTCYKYLAAPTFSRLAGCNAHLR